MITRLFLLISLSLVFPVTGFAQSDDDEVRYYDVEVVIFKNSRAPRGKELTLPVSSPRKDKKILDLSSKASIKAAAKKSYTVLRKTELQLHDRVAKIVKSPYYELLVHAGWRQPGLDLEKSLPIWIRAGRKFGNEYVSIDNHMINQVNSAANEFANNSSGLNQSSDTGFTPSVGGTVYELEGKITVALARYLHAYTDLVLRRPRVSPKITSETSEQTQLSQRELADSHILDNHSMKERRRMRSKSLHYLDNPEFSMLIYITPYVATDINTPPATQ